jgi:hypothetical protein
MISLYANKHKHEKESITGNEQIQNNINPYPANVENMVSS